MKTKETKQNEAIIRNQNCSFLSARDRIVILNEKGFVAKKERTRLCEEGGFSYDGSFNIVRTT